MPAPILVVGEPSLKPRTEKLGDQAAVKGTMLLAHLGWARERLGEPAPRLQAHVSAPTASALSRGVLATDWVSLRTLIEIDRAIALELGGRPEDTYRELGRHSAVQNLAGVYKQFLVEEPHRFFEQMTLLHGRFQNFGRSSYERAEERSGRIRAEGYEERSPVYCSSAVGYYSGALEMMKVPEPHVAEVRCQCAGDEVCLFEVSW